MEELFLWLFIIAITIAIVVYVVLPLSIFLLIGIGIVGAVSGVGVALYNFGQLLIEAHKTVK